jgi:thiol-disulfide isomerase/thioredoxin
MKTILRRSLVLGAPAVFLPKLAASQPAQRFIVGTYDDKRLWSVKALTFPRVLAYSPSGSLIPRDSWPTALRSLKEQAGDAFCCVSDKPAPPGSKEPPADCKIVVYGEDINEHFDGLRTADRTPIRHSQLPAHRYLVVEYFASWCAPCKPAREALLALLTKPEGQEIVAVVVDFSRRVPGKRPGAA